MLDERAAEFERHHDEPFFALITRAHATLCICVSVFLLALFMAVYSGADYITGLRASHLRIDFALEHRLPFVPELSVIYSSLYLMFLAVPFVLRTRDEIIRFTWLMATVTIVAGACFLVLPAEIGFVIPDKRGVFPSAFNIADQLNLTYNLCPSLHVGYSVTCAEVFRYKRARFGWIFHAWALAVAVSAWMTYQHHLLDLLGGYALGVSATYAANRWPTSDHKRSEFK